MCPTYGALSLFISILLGNIKKKGVFHFQKCQMDSFFHHIMCMVYRLWRYIIPNYNCTNNTGFPNNQ
ncbi:hypothetical protein F2P79_008095 [Pimephales promelas]|nr:hypothetical protein F2P79_008095 [Pimephales promelas]